MKKGTLHRTSFRFFYPLLVKMRGLGQNRLILVLSLVVGILSGLAAVVLKNLVHFIHTELVLLLDKDSESYLFLALPGVGILFTLLFVRYVIRDNLSHGVTKILYAMSRHKSRIKPHNTYSSMVASAMTIGFGGSVGAEAPIVYTGAAIGSNIGQMFRVNYKTLTLLVGCGAAGAIASIFKAPIAGLVFTLEILMLDLTMASIVPLLISAVSAATVSYFLLGRGVVFDYTVIRPFALHNIPYFIILGIFCGLVSLYFTRVLMKVESKFSQVKSPYKKWILGSVVLGLLVFLFPPLYGEGYDTLQALLDGRWSAIFDNSLLYSFQNEYWLLLLSLVMILATKVLATAATTGAGGIGGTFAPTLFMGGVAGFFVARLINQFSFIDVSESNFALVGMAGMMAGVMHAPLTAIFLIAEITGGYALFIPLMIASTISYMTIMYFEPHSIYTKRLAAKGDLLTHHKDKAVLTLMRIGAVVETDLSIINPDDSLGRLVKTISKSKRNIFPVVDNDGMMLGIVLLDDIRDIMFNADMYENTYVRELMSLPPDFIYLDEPMDSVMRKFEDTRAWNLPVVDKGRYVGFVSKSKIFNAYRDVLVQFSDE